LPEFTRNGRWRIVNEYRAEEVKTKLARLLAEKMQAKLARFFFKILKSTSFLQFFL